MKDNYINVVFVVDESSSMHQSETDVIAGFQKVIEEQKANTDGKCTVSLFTFATTVKELYLGEDVKNIEKLEGYSPFGMTAMNDGIGIAIDKVGKWLADMEESERPSKTMVVIMTDGGENCSKEYTLAKVQEMIKHQTDKYSWEFVYIGTDITSKRDATRYGIKTMAFATRDNYSAWSSVVNSATTTYRRCKDIANASASLKCALDEKTLSLTNDTEVKIGRKISD